MPEVNRNQSNRLKKYCAALFSPRVFRNSFYIRRFLWQDHSIIPRMENEESSDIKKVVGIYNMIANLTWSALLVTPVAVFCYTHMNRRLFWFFLITSLLAAFLPRSFFDSIEIGKSASVYKKIGVGFINRFTQNGDIINALIRKRYPGYKVISSDRKLMSKLINQTYMFEMFHFAGFLFFSLVVVYAFAERYFMWAFIILGSNIIYNVYPAFLQQYIRARLKVFQKRVDR